MVIFLAEIMIVDNDKSAIIEFIDNEMVVIENENIMINFYLTDFDSNNLPKHAMGIERYNILKDNYNYSTIKEGMVELMKKVFYSKAYNLYTNPFWYSEFSGVYCGIDLTTENVGEYNLNVDLSKSGEYQTYLERIQELYKNQSRNKLFWVTTHSSVYDLKNKTLNVIVQESNINHEFKLNI